MRRLVAAVSGLSLATVGLLTGPTHAASTAPTLRWVTVVPAFSDPLPTRAQATSAAFQSAQRLVDSHRGGMLGSYVDGRGHVVVVAGSSSGVSVAERRLSKVAGARVERASLTINQASRLGSDVRALTPGLTDDVFAWGGDARSGGMWVMTSARPSASDLRALEHFGATHQVALRVEVDAGAGHYRLTDRYTDTSPFAGGALYARTDGLDGAVHSRIKERCTTGYGYLKDGKQFMLTAGHCDDRSVTSADNWIYDTTVTGTDILVDFMGPAPYSTYVDPANAAGGDGGNVKMGDDNGYHGDLALINVSNNGNAAGDQIWWGPPDATSKIPVTARSAPSNGMAVCFSGYMSGADCGTTVFKTNATHVYDLGSGNTETLVNVDLSSSSSWADCPIPGDSGAPVVVNHSGAETQATAVGVVSGRYSDSSHTCVLVFTGVEEAMQAWGGQLNFH